MMQTKNLNIQLSTNKQAKTLELSKAVEINVSDPSVQFIHIDRMKDGTFRLTFTKGMLVTDEG